MELVKSIVTLLVGCAVFIVGMNMMSSGLKKATGKGLKNLLRKIQNSRFAGLAIGMAVTALIQSSGAASVMVIGFINAGVMSVFQGVSIIMGSAIGTTITGVLASLSTFGISKYLCLLAIIGVILMFFKNEKIKHIGEICAGLGILFFGLETMSGAFTAEGSPVLEVSKNLFAAVNNPLLLLLIGALFTALIQSSSATSGIVIVMVSSGALRLSSGFYLCLGATIGTVIVVLLATIGGNTDVKRTGFIALVIKASAALLATLIIWPFESQIESFFANTFATTGFALAMFIVIFAVIFMLLFLPFIKFFVKLSEIVIKDKPNKTLEGAVKYIDNRLLNTPTVALMQTKKEIVNMMDLAYNNLHFAYDRIINSNKEHDNEITECEDKIDYINNSITSYLISLGSKVEASDERKVGAYFHVINDIERIGDHACNFLDSAKTMDEDDISFSSVAKEEFNKMFSLIDEMSVLSREIFENKDYASLKRLHELEEQTDILKTELSDAHYKRISKNECKVELSPFYTTLVTELERIADHMVNIGYSIVSPTGDDEEEVLA